MSFNHQSEFFYLNHFEFRIHLAWVLIDVPSNESNLQFSQGTGQLKTADEQSRELQCSKRSFNG